MTFNKQKRFFNKKVREAIEAIWVWEFKLFIARELREERRKQRDRTVEKIDGYGAKLMDTNLKDEAKEELKRLRDEQIKYQAHLEDDIAIMDIKINGADFEALPQEKKDLYIQKIQPDEWIGMLTTIESMRERVEMYRQYIKEL